MSNANPMDAMMQISQCVLVNLNGAEEFIGGCMPGPRGGDKTFARTRMNAGGAEEKLRASGTADLETWVCLGVPEPRTEDICSIEPTGRSLRPERLFENLKEVELRDLFADLEQSQPFTR